MNDYLTTLISTNLNLVPTLQPRVTALFEPASSSELNAGEREIYETARDETAAPAPPMPLVVVERDTRSEASTEDRADSLRAPEETTATPRALEPKSRANAMIPRPAAAAESSPRVEANGPQAPATPPVIRVTIGRVEVRAVQAPVPMPPKKSAEPPKISLEEYLKGRER